MKTTISILTEQKGWLDSFKIHPRQPYWEVLDEIKAELNRLKNKVSLKFVTPNVEQKRNKECDEELMKKNWESDGNTTTKPLDNKVRLF